MTMYFRGMFKIIDLVHGCESLLPLLKFQVTNDSFNFVYMKILCLLLWKISCCQQVFSTFVMSGDG
jgi:hypothetical protein